VDHGDHPIFAVRQFVKDRTLPCRLGGLVFSDICVYLQTSAFIQSSIPVFRSPDHPITGDHPIFAAPTPIPPLLKTNVKPQFDKTVTRQSTPRFCLFSAPNPVASFLPL
jgi:hypothetical protein